MSEFEAVLRKTRVALAPGPSGVPYKVFKSFGGIRLYLWKAPRAVWCPVNGVGKEEFIFRCRRRL